MSQKNGYIQIEILDNDSICHFYPPSEGGEKLSPKEALDYLMDEGFSGFDNEEFIQKLSSGREEHMYLGLGPGADFSGHLPLYAAIIKWRIFRDEGHNSEAKRHGNYLWH